MRCVSNLLEYTLKFLPGKVVVQSTQTDAQPVTSSGSCWSSRSGCVMCGGQGLDLQLASLSAATSVDVIASDVGDALDGVGMLGSTILAGILHAAGVLRDRLLRSMTDEDLDGAFAPKAVASSHLHSSAAWAPLDAFGLFSSASATFGNIGQGNYAAANAHLDGLALLRRAAQPAPQPVDLRVERARALAHPQQV